MGVCASCQGRKVVTLHVCFNENGRRRGEWRQIQCPICSGTGEVSEEQEEWARRGEAMREDRKSRGLALREEARRLNVSPLELSDAEAGRINPEEVLSVNRLRESIGK